MAFSLIALIFLIGLALLVLELFVPGGFIGFIGSAVLVTSIILAFYYHSPIHGLSLVAITAVIIPMVIIWWLKKISLNTSQNVEDGYSAEDGSLESLVGQNGITITILRPSGIAKINGRRVDVTTENIVLEPNTPIQVVKVDANRVIVQATGPAQIEE